MFRKYRKKILIWYTETLTNHAKAQYVCKRCYIEPLGFFPNKDLFCNKIESEFLQVAYDKKVLKQYRIDKIPKIILEVIKCFMYSSLKYDLISVDFVEPKINLNLKETLDLKKKLNHNKKKDKHGYIEIFFSFNNSNSYFKFLYNPKLKNIVNIKYEVNNLEELSVFLRKLREFIIIKYIRYCECYVSAYNPSHQRLFSLFEFNPRGYIPCWKFNKDSGFFEDQILFNFFNGEISDTIECLKEIEMIRNLFIEE